MSTTLVQNEKSTIGKLIDCQNYSDYEKLVRVTCYVVRFVKCLRKMKEHRPSSLELDETELSEAEVLWIKDAQRYFHAEKEIVAIIRRSRRNFKIARKTGFHSVTLLCTSSSHFAKGPSSHNTGRYQMS